MEEALIKRVMPHDEEAESSVIGAMLIDNEAIMDCLRADHGGGLLSEADGSRL